VDRVYRLYSARMKKSWCLALHRAGRLKPSAFVLWIVTYECNFRCSFCEAGAGERARSELTTEEGEALLDDMGRMGVRRVLISGGEPAMRPDLPVLLKRAERLSIAPGLISNGSLIEQRWDELKPFRYFLYVTSVDDLEEQHDQARASGSYRRALRALELVASIGVATRVVNTVVQPRNLTRLPELAARLEASGATDWRLSPVFAVGRAAGQTGLQMSGAELRALLAFLGDYRSHRGLRVELAESCSYLDCLAGRSGGRPFFCGAGLTRCAVMANGDVLACGQAYNAAVSEGNVRDVPLSRIWKSGFAAFRNNRQPDGCRGCGCWSACQGGCWAQREIDGGCFRGAWLQ
jgi:radical SAM protein with 4Fe4S-binding SPASM domain